MNRREQLGASFVGSSGALISAGLFDSDRAVLFVGGIISAVLAIGLALAEGNERV